MSIQIYNTCIFFSVFSGFLEIKRRIMVKRVKVYKYRVKTHYFFIVQLTRDDSKKSVDLYSIPGQCLQRSFLHSDRNVNVYGCGYESNRLKVLRKTY